MKKKTLLTIVLALLMGSTMQAQLLWKISGNGLEKPSYIIGTHHLASVAFIDEIAGVKEALTASEQVFGELNMDVMANADSLALMQEAMLLPDGQTLKDVLTPQQFDKVDKFLLKTMGVGFKSPEVLQSMGRMTPQTLTTQLVVISYMMNHMGEFDPTAPFDSYFQLQAKHNNMPVGGLETLAFQSDLLYRSYSMERQSQLLECFVDHYDFQVQMLEKLSAAFKAQDLDALKAASDEKIGNQCDNTPEEDAALISNRNKVWAAKIPAIMQSAATFFAVGSLHLPGEDGLLQLLRNQGYTVEGVK